MIKNTLWLRGIYEIAPNINPLDFLTFELKDLIVISIYVVIYVHIVYFFQFC